jgi:hypothetical protein
MNSLPSSVNYGEVLPSLPENSTRYSVALQPNNGATFGYQQQIQFQQSNNMNRTNSMSEKFRVLLLPGSETIPF